MSDVLNSAERLRLVFSRSSIWPEEQLRIIQDIFSDYDRRRKRPGKGSGAFPLQGPHCWLMLTGSKGAVPDAGVDWGSFREFRPLSTSSLAEQLFCARGTAIAIIHAMVEHGFAERQRSGPSGQLRLMIPTAAIIDFADGLLSEYAPQRSVSPEILRSALLAEF